MSFSASSEASPTRNATERLTESCSGLSNDQLLDAYPPLKIDAETDPPHEMSYPTIETLQYGGTLAQESASPTSTCYSGTGARIHIFHKACCGCATPVPESEVRKRSRPRRALELRTTNAIAAKWHRSADKDMRHSTNIQCASLFRRKGTRSARPWRPREGRGRPL
jgi:hypothetical protein